MKMSHRKKLISPLPEVVNSTSSMMLITALVVTANCTRDAVPFQENTNQWQFATQELKERTDTIVPVTN